MIPKQENAVQFSTQRTKLFNVRCPAFFRKEWLGILLCFLLMRLVISGMGVFTLWSGNPAPPQWIPPSHPSLQALIQTTADQRPAARLLLNGWYRWDTGYFVEIGLSGYSVQNGTLSFMPLYPFFIRLLFLFSGANALLSALIVSNLFCLAALILFYEVALLELGSNKEAWQAFLFLITFPAAFFLYAGYSESIYLALTLAMWLLIRRRKWLLAGFVSGLALLTRLQGIALAFPLGWQALVTMTQANSLPPLSEARSVLSFLATKNGLRSLFTGKSIPVWAAALLPVITLLFYNTGVRLTWMNSVFNAYSERNSVLAFPWQGIGEFLARIFTMKYLPSDYVDLFLLVFFIGVSALGAAKIRPALSLYSFAVLGLVFSRSYPANLLSGFMRFMLTTFPFFLALSRLRLNGWMKNALMVLFLIVQLFLTWLFFMWVWVA